ncbi:MAG: hypothetical protein HY692_08770, partial [Cyanobacteria bacterium NC_groundwater_1444_Ag_S-0.65um_54_12]|nr:hypothetical protein [Cyanobacteria bacterium NC_groundwater_1444_Ag_S-0.65um_54_12]
MPVIIAPDQRQAVGSLLSNCAARIYKGVQDSSLTSGESQNLTRVLNEIAAKLEKASRDGIDEAEYASLLGDVSGLSRGVHDQRTNSQGSNAWYDNTTSEDLGSAEKSAVLGVAVGNLKGRLVAGIMSGKINPVEQAQLESRIRDLESRIQNQKTSGGALLGIDETEFTSDLGDISSISQ